MKEGLPQEDGGELFPDTTNREYTGRELPNNLEAPTDDEVTEDNFYETVASPMPDIETIAMSARGESLPMSSGDDAGVHEHSPDRTHFEVIQFVQNHPEQLSNAKVARAIVNGFLNKT